MSDENGRIVPAGKPDRRAENWVIALLLLAALLAVLFIVLYATGTTLHPLPHKTQLLGASIGGCFACIGFALMIVAKRLVVTEEIEEDYPEAEHPEQRAELARMVEESGSRFTRKKLLLGAGGVCAGTVGLAVATPAVSLGPVFTLHPLYHTQWRRGVRLLDENGRPYRAQDIERETFYTAFPEGGNHHKLGAPLIVVRMEPAKIHLPTGRVRARWAPDGILAYSKICTHAGCAVSLYRKPTFAAVEPGPALVCPCHYSTFNPADGGTVEYGPAGRALPQLPLMIDRRGHLRANGNFSGPVGPSWWGVREGRAD
jgi:ubiquinol-cytochrome c reductase iron-sulfur subunit